MTEEQNSQAGRMVAESGWEELYRLAKMKNQNLEKPVAPFLPENHISEHNGIDNLHTPVYF